MISLKNLKCNRPKKKWDDKWDGLYKVLRVSDKAEIVDLPKHIKINNSFHTSLIRLQKDQFNCGQTQLNEKEYRNVVGHVAERDNVGHISDKRMFEKIHDVDDEDKNERGLRIS